MVTGHIKEWDNVEENGNWVELLEGWFVRTTACSELRLHLE